MLKVFEGKKNKYFLMLLGIIVIAAFLRFYELGSLPPGLYPDEAVNGINTIQALETGAFKAFYPENFGREGLFINIQAISVAIFGHESSALRGVSGVIGTLTVLGIFFLVLELLRFGRGVIDEKSRYATALLASFFLATNFWHINFSRIGFRAISAPFWGILAFYIALLAWRKLKENPLSKKYLLLALLAGLVFGLGIHSYIAYRVMPVLMGLVFIFQFVEAKRLQLLPRFYKYAALVVIGAAISATPLLIHFLQVPGDFSGRTSEISIFSSKTPLKDLALNAIKTVGMFNVVGDFNERHNVKGRPELFFPVGMAFLIGLYLTLKNIIKVIWRFFKKIPNDFYDIDFFFVSMFLWCWLKIAALPVVISDEGLPHSLRAILMIPPVFIFAAIGAKRGYDWFVEKIKQKDGINEERFRKVLRLAAACLFAVLIIEAYHTYFVLFGENPNTADSFSTYYTDIALELRALPTELKKYVVIDQGNMGINVIQFLTDTYYPAKQSEKNLYYATPGQIDPNNPPAGSYVTVVK